MDIKPKFCEKYIIHRKSYFDENVNDEITERARRVQDPASSTTTTKCSRRITRQVRDLVWQLKVKGRKYNGIARTMKIWK